MPNVHRIEDLGDLEYQKGDLIVILGHSVNSGKTIILSNGGRVPVVEHHLNCLAQGLRCVYLTCNSGDFLIGSLSTKDALAMWKKAYQVHQKPGRPFVADEFILEMRRARAVQTWKDRIFVSGMVVGTTGGIYVAVSSTRL